jgi:two-component system, NtrC family, response regulator AtoC
MWPKRKARDPKRLPLRPPFEPLRQFGGLSTRCPAMCDVFDLLARFAPTEVTVTLLGETGTGKDVLAHALHEQSPRASGPFVVFDCASVAPNLAESELFGHERGAFTGAMSTHVGAFERADGGTLFLDEIGELPIDLQPRLLRVLESRGIRRVGGTQDRPLDLRVIAATHRALVMDVAAGRFRQDLFYRLAGAVVRVPPLRRRFEDLPLLVEELLQELGQTELVVTDAAFDVLRKHSWPGNIRELKNCLACSTAFVEDDVLEPHHIRLLGRLDSAPRIERLALAGQTLDDLERTAIQQTLIQFEGNKLRAAEALGIAVSTLYEKLKKYGL